MDPAVDRIARSQLGVVQRAELVAGLTDERQLCERILHPEPGTAA
jgi:hypothetical protein